ncbi:PKD domain-containing protein [Candidatus Pacearchaeota archaeon]|nr:PKD domain-containing protein [Candidatus Pacearchaeota archaeon]
MDYKKEAGTLIFAFLALFLIMLAFSPNADAAFLKGNKTAEIQAEYSPSEAIKGWINISLTNESADSQLSTNFNDSISLINILQKNNLSQSINCTNSICTSKNKFVKIQIDSAEFKAPLLYGNYTLIILLGNNEMAAQNIIVSKIPAIKSLSPTIAPAAVSVDFIVNAYSPENLSFAEYTWDFGDGSTTKTTANKASHAYPDVKKYSLKITAKDAKGQTATKEFTIDAVSPAVSANESINEKTGHVKNISGAIALYPEWQREFISGQLNITGIDSQLYALRQGYNSATKTEHYVAIMKNLTMLKVPKKLSGIVASGIKFSVIPGSIDMEKLKSAGAGDYKANKSSDYRNAIGAWFAEKIDAALSFEAISAELDNKEILDIATKIKLKIKPKESLKDVYLVVEKSPASIKFKDAAGKDASGGVAVSFSELSANSEKDIELIVAGSATIEDIFEMVYLSPKLTELNLDVQIEPCNFNKACEKDKGETWKNCRKDCKPVGLIIFYIFLVLAAAFIAYIILQEWYKRHYESSLFKNKNDLYNLLAFIENAKKQGLNEGEIARKLKEAKWSGEQVAYALKKHKGQGAGMWEIPIFRGMENKKIRQEIMKRTAQSMPPSIYKFKH